MADKIRGITVEIGAKADSLSKVLKQVNSEVKTTQQSLKEVDKLLKFDPKNTTLLKEKQSLLNKEIAATKTKLDAMKQAQKEAAQMLANGEIDQGQYDRLTKDIEKTEKALQNLEAEAADTSKKIKVSAEDVGKAFQDAGQKIEDAGKKLAPFSAAAAAGLGVAVKTAASFDEEMSKVQAISGATGEDFDALRTKARQMGETTKFSAEEAGQAMEYMAMAGWKTEDMLDGVEGIMNLAAASGSDLATTSDIVTDALTAMGYSSKEAGHLADVMAAASSNANTNVQLMGETFKYAAAVGGSYGYTMEDVALATGLMANQGIKGSQAGTALRSIMSRLATDAGASSKKLGALGTLTEKLGVAFYNADGTMRPFRKVIEDVRKKWGKLTQAEQANYAKTIAGQNAMTGWLALMNSAEDDFNKLADAVDNSTGTAQNMADVMQDNLAGQLTILKSQLSELAISIGDTMMPTIRKVVGYVQDAVDWLNSLDEETKETITTVALVVAALSPVLIIGGKLISGIGSLITGVSSLVGWLGAAAAPVTALVAAGALLVTAITSINNYYDELRENAAKLTEEEQALKEKVETEAQAWDETKKSRLEAAQAAKDHADRERELWEQLDKLVDKNGKVKKGHEEEAQAIMGELKEAYGWEFEMVGRRIENYNELKQTLEDVITTHEAEALLAADEENFIKAKEGLADAEKTYQKALDDRVAQEKLIEETEKRLAEVQEEANKATRAAYDDRGTTAQITQDYNDQIKALNVTLEGQKRHLDVLSDTEKTARENLQDLNNVIDTHKDLTKAVATGSIPEMQEAMYNLEHSFITAEHGSKASLERQARDLIETYRLERQTVQETGDEITRLRSYQTHEAVQKALNELKQFDPQLAAELEKEVRTINAQSVAWNRGGQAAADAYTNAINNGVKKVDVESKIKAAMDLKNKASVWGKDLDYSYANSINSHSHVIKNAVSGVAKTIEKYLGFSEPELGPLSEFHTFGPDMMELLAKGINDESWRVLQAAQGVAANLRASLEGTTLTAQLDQKSIPLGAGVTLNIANFNNYSDSDIRELTNEIMETAASFAQRKGAVYA